MKFSIITVSLNSEKTIEKTIKSVLEQGVDDLEYIIIDGGSSDQTLNIINKYKNRISQIISEKDEGVSDAFNKGLKLASGEIIGIINSDDWYEAGALKTVAEMMSSSETNFVVGALKYWDSNGRGFTVKPDKDYQKRIGYKMPHLNHPAAFFRKSVYEKIGLFDKKYHYAMDYDFFLRVFKNNLEGKLSDQILANMNLSGLSDRNAIKAYRETLEIADKKIKALVYFIYSVAKYLIRLSLEKIDSGRLLNLIRKIKYQKI